MIAGRHKQLLITFCGLYTCLAATAGQAQDAYSRFDQLRRLARFGQAEELAQGQRQYFEQNAPHEIPSIAWWSRNLGRIYLDQGRYAEAQTELTRALSLAEKHGQTWPKDVYDLTAYQLDLANVYLERNMFQQAEPLIRAALEYRRRGKLVDPKVQRASLERAVAALRAQGQSQLAAEVEKHLRDTPQDDKTRREVNSGALAESLDQFGQFLLETGNYIEAEKAFEEALALREEIWGPLQQEVASSMDRLGRLYVVAGHYTKAELRLKRAVSIREQVLDNNDPSIAVGLTNLAAFYQRMDQFAAADELLRRAHAIYAQRNWLGHPDAAATWHAWGTLYAERGRFAEAEAALRKALVVRRNIYSERHKSLAQSLDALAGLYVQHGRLDEAREMARESLAIRETVFGPQHVEVAAACSRLGGIEQRAGAYPTARELFQRSVSLRTAALHAQHADVGQSLSELAGAHAAAGDEIAAGELLRQSRDILLQQLGPAHRQVIDVTIQLANIEWRQGNDDRAATLAATAAEHLADAAAGPATASRLHALTAQIAWKNQDQSAAIEQLMQAIQYAEQQRDYATGGEQEQAALFAEFAGLYHQLMAWQLALGDVPKAFAAMEQMRGRSLFDQLAMQGADPLAGLEPEARDALRRQGALASMRASGLARQFQLMSRQPEQSQQEFEQLRKKVAERLQKAQQELLDHYRQVRAASRMFQLAGNDQFRAADLHEAEAFVREHNALLLAFASSHDQLVRLVIPADGPARMDSVVVSPDLAESLGVAAGAITADKFRAMFRIGNTDLDRVLADPVQWTKAQPRLHALWKLLLTDQDKESLVAKKYRMLIVLPDGPLTRLPLETLIVQNGNSPLFLLDEGPPVLYAPSATLLLRLADPQRSPAAAKQAVLTVGDPAYDLDRSANGRETAESGAYRTRFTATAGGLSRLPYTARETQWVADAFKKNGISVQQLSGDQATEANCRQMMPGCTWIHLACHGLCDQASGNLFGALALTPGTEELSDPENDGFLTLAEIYQLNLSGTELAILSACDTNSGPLSQGEGAWAVSRGFLVAGSRRVVATNWLVDDEAAASLVSVLCESLSGHGGDGPVAYAEHLQKAKRWVRGQEKWASPYYWGAFELIGGH
jgi:CHAT domain-containing protein/uncharacterized protein HemY